MKISDLSLIILISVIISLIILSALDYSEKMDEIRELKARLNSSQIEIMALELSEKMLDSEIERKNAQLEDMRNWVSDSRTLNITIKEQIVYLNKTYAIMMFEPEQYPERLGYTRLDYTIHLRNGMTLYDYYKVCTHESGHNNPKIGRNETAAKEAEKMFNRECFYFAEFLFEKIMEISK